MALVKGKFVDKDIPIQSNADPVDDKDLARKVYVDTKAAAEAAAAVAGIDLSGKVDKAGDVMLGDLSMSQFLIKSLGLPIDLDDAANKGYVDSGLSTKQDNLGTGTTSQFLRGDLTWQEIAASIEVAQTIHVAKNGDDSTGNGSLSTPFLTVQAAMAAITDASPTKRYIIKVASGTYVETGDLELKANVFIVGDNKMATRITPAAFKLHSSFSGGDDNRSGYSNITLNAACDFDWEVVTSAAGKLYFYNCNFNSTYRVYGYNNGIAQTWVENCSFFNTSTISGINAGVNRSNIHYGAVNLEQHPILATIFNAVGGSAATTTLTTTVDDFNKRCSAFLFNFWAGDLTVDGPQSYADATSASMSASSPVLLNGGRYIPINPGEANTRLDNLVFPTAVNNPIMPANSNATNLGDWGKQWMFSFNYVNGSTGTDLYLISTMAAYDGAGDSEGRTIYVQSDAYGLQADVNGGNIELETAAVSGTGVRGKVQVKARELDMTAAKITNLADGVDPQDAVTKAQLDAISVGGGLTGKKEVFTLSAADIANGYVDCAHLAAADTMLLMSGGVVHQEVESYTLSEVGGVTRITFTGDLVAPSESQLLEGDKVYIQYMK